MLIGLGRADWVLVENVVFGVVKIVLLVALATALPDEGIFASWTLPLILIVVSGQRAGVPPARAASRRRPRGGGRAGPRPRPRALPHRGLLRVVALDRDHEPPAAHRAGRSPARSRARTSTSRGRSRTRCTCSAGTSACRSSPKARGHRSGSTSSRSARSPRARKIVVPLAVVGRVALAVDPAAVRSGVRRRRVAAAAAARALGDPERRHLHVPERGPRAAPDARGRRGHRGDVDQRDGALGRAARPLRADRVSAWPGWWRSR